MTDDHRRRPGHPAKRPTTAGRLEEALSPPAGRSWTACAARGRAVRAGVRPTRRRLADLRERFGDLDPGPTRTTEVRVAGRIVLLRRQGKLVVRHAPRPDGRPPAVHDADTDMGDGCALVEDLDLGDIVGAEGASMTTKRGELSVRVERLTLLTKALRPLPEKWHGLRDPDLQQRQRHLHLATDPTPALLRRSAREDAARDPRVPRRAWLRRGGDAGPAVDRRRRDGPAVRARTTACWTSTCTCGSRSSCT